MNDIIKLMERLLKTTKTHQNKDFKYKYAFFQNKTSSEYFMLSYDYLSQNKCFILKWYMI